MQNGFYDIGQISKNAPHPNCSPCNIGTQRVYRTPARTITPHHHTAFGTIAPAKDTTRYLQLRGKIIPIRVTPSQRAELVAAIKKFTESR